MLFRIPVFALLKSANEQQTLCDDVFNDHSMSEKSVAISQGIFVCVVPILNASLSRELRIDSLEFFELLSPRFAQYR